MAFVAAGASLGSLIHPILLNNLFSRVGYRKTTLLSAGFVTSLLLMACILMHPPLLISTSRPPIIKSLRQFYKERSFIMLSVGQVPFMEPVHRYILNGIIPFRVIFFTIGYYYPFFILQLDASKHGINETLTFYLVYTTHPCFALHDSFSLI